MTWTATTGADVRTHFPTDVLAKAVLTDDAPAVVGDTGWAAHHPWVREWDESGITVSMGTDDVEGALAALLPCLSDEPTPVGFVSLSRDHAPQPDLLNLPDGWRIAGGDGLWDLMTATYVTPRASSLGIIELDDAADAEEIHLFNQLHNPDSEGRPGKGHTQVWLGMRHPGGTLAAVGALQRLGTGVPYLAGLVVDESMRGQGLGGALLTELSHRALADSDMVTLGVDKDNAGAISLYRRMGYVTAAEFDSRSIVPPWRQLSTDGR